jgi:hypothetical protein
MINQLITFCVATSALLICEGAIMNCGFLYSDMHMLTIQLRNCCFCTSISKLRSLATVVYVCNCVCTSQ